MNNALIDEAFIKLIRRRGIHTKLGISSGRVRTYRYNLSKGIAISIGTKINVLRKSGWRPDDKLYNRKDLVSLLNFWKRTSQHARDQGPEYVIEKWETNK